MTPRTDKFYEEVWRFTNETDAVDALISMVMFCRELERENAALRKVLSDADEIERYNGSDGHRQWGKCSTWINPNDAVIIVSAKALDSARKEAQP